MLNRFKVMGASALLLGVCFVPMPASHSQNASAPKSLTPAQKSAYFDKSVWPILQASCMSCHAGKDASGGLDLSTRAGLMKGGFSGSAVSRTSML